MRSPARCSNATPRRQRELRHSRGTSAAARKGTIPLREGASHDTTEYCDHPPSPCNDGAAHQPPPKTRMPAAQALTERNRERHQPAGPLAGVPWRVRGGERGQTWACTAPGSHLTAPASARAPALEGHGGCCPHRPKKKGPEQAHGGGPYPCGKGRLATPLNTTGTWQAPADQIGPARPQRSGRASGPLWRTGVPPTSAGGPRG